MRSAIYRLNKSSLHLAEIGFVDPVFGKKNFKNKYGRKKVCGPEFFQSSQSFGLHNIQALRVTPNPKRAA